MTPRRRKLIFVSLGALAALLAVLTIAGIWVAQSGWFHDYVRQRIIQTVEESTGGRVEVGEFLFDWRHLRAEIRQFVLRGTEPADQDPLFRARSITVELRFLSLTRRRKVDIASLDVGEPRANLIVYPDGRTNIPQPNIARNSDTTALETLVDLAIGRFTVEQGSLNIANQKIPFSARGSRPCTTSRATYAHSPRIGRRCRCRSRSSFPNPAVFWSASPIGV